MMQQYCLVLPALAKLPKLTLYPYHYNSGEFSLGQLVQIEFGKKSSHAIIVKLINKDYLGDMNIEKVKTIDSTKQDIVAKQDIIIPEDLLKLVEWMGEYYPSKSNELFSTLLPSDLGKLIKRTVKKEHYYISKIDETADNPTNIEQQTIIKDILKRDSNFLIHGLTGTGKTNIYIEIIKKNLLEGKSTHVIVPEIALTPELSSRLASFFEVYIWHSRLTKNQKLAMYYELIEKYEQGIPVVVLGARSALFAPVYRLGNIIIDEEHESSLKQSSNPKYIARDIAAYLCNITGAQLILGSATPSISSYFLAKNNRLKLVELTKRPLRKKKPNLVIAEQDKSVFSPQLRNSLEANLARGEKSLILLNLRGNYSSYICKDCKEAAKCTSCNINLSWHQDKFRLVCHNCSKSFKLSLQCLDCKSYGMIMNNIGTKQLIIELEKLFPYA